MPQDHEDWMDHSDEPQGRMSRFKDWFGERFAGARERFSDWRANRQQSKSRGSTLHPVKTTDSEPAARSYDSAPAYAPRRGRGRMSRTAGRGIEMVKEVALWTAILGGGAAGIYHRHEIADYVGRVTNWEGKQHPGSFIDEVFKGPDLGGEKPAETPVKKAGKKGKSQPAQVEEDSSKPRPVGKNAARSSLAAKQSKEKEQTWGTLFHDLMNPHR